MLTLDSPTDRRIAAEMAAKDSAADRRERWIEDRTEALVNNGSEHDPWTVEHVAEGFVEGLALLSPEEAAQLALQIKDDPAMAGHAVRAIIYRYWTGIAEDAAEREYRGFDCTICLDRGCRFCDEEMR